MYGVVLWCDHVDGKAVIWCDDHGDLAYFNSAFDGQPVSGLQATMQAGDLVQFDLLQDGRVRRALQPRLVANQHCAGLADGLADRVRPRVPTKPQPRPAAPFGAEVTGQVGYQAGGQVGYQAGAAGRVISFALAAQSRMAARLTAV